MTDVVTDAVNPFPNYTQLPRRVPVGAWHAVRVVSVASFFGLCVMLWVRPAGSLFFFWNVLVPLLPITFMVMPGLWRNVCPLAAANQTPRLFGFTRGWTQPAFLRNRGYVVAIALFAAIMASRKPLFDHNGAALSVLLLGTIGAAFAMGALFKGKSGWCSSICPLLPIQRLYGQTPFAVSPNGHCQPCVGCTKNCYDFNPRAAYQADMHEDDVDWSMPRLFFAGAFPGLVWGFFTVEAGSGTLAVYGHIFLCAAVGAGIGYALRALLPLSPSQVAALGAVAAINVYYYHRGTTIFHTYSEIFNAGLGWMRLVVRTSVPLISAWWLWRTLRVERVYKEQVAASARPVKLSPSRTAKLGADAATTGGPEVTFQPGDRRVVALEGATLLEVAESDGQAIEAGCRMGMCGSDPIAVLEGMANLSPVLDDEATTLRRLGLGPGARMACSARVQGAVCVSLATESLGAAAASVGPTGAGSFDPSIQRVVVLGNGIAGVTAADFVRRNHPDCEIHLVGKEPHPLYNRMGISRVVYGRSAMQGLFLLPESWYEDHKVTLWLNTVASRLDVEGRRVWLATGEELVYDRLILATGSSSSVPPIPGYGAAGSFVLRDADDAIAIRRYAQSCGAGARAVVAGGGLLGLEAAHALHALGLATTVVELAPRLLVNQADERASELLADYLANLGIRVATGTSVASVRSGEDGRVAGVELADGRTVPCSVFLVAAGISPNAALARDAGLVVNRGVVVDDRMRTSVPGVYAAGDVAELDGQVWGLWPIAVNQAEVAALNALGADAAHVSNVPFAVLKGVGIDLLSAGRIHADTAAGDEAVVFDEGREHRYAKVVVAADGRVVGGLLLGRPADHAAVTEAVKSGAAAESLLAKLRPRAVQAV